MFGNPSATDSEAKINFGEKLLSVVLGLRIDLDEIEADLSVSSLSLRIDYDIEAGPNLPFYFGDM